MTYVKCELNFALASFKRDYESFIEVKQGLI